MFKATLQITRELFGLYFLVPRSDISRTIFGHAGVFVSIGNLIVNGVLSRFGIVRGRSQRTALRAVAIADLRSNVRFAVVVPKSKANVVAVGSLVENQGSLFHAVRFFQICPVAISWATRKV